MLKNEVAIRKMMKGECFRILAACFYYPKKEILADERFLAALAQNLRSTCPAAAPFPERMMQGVASSTEEELGVEYAGLFVGPFALKAPPYGSIYLDGEHTVMGPSTMETIRFYEQEGLARDEGFTELPDHVAVELEFMYFLIYKEVESLEKGEPDRAQEYQRKQEEFSANFLEKWIPPFCVNIKDSTDNVFYTALADCLTTLVECACVADEAHTPI